MAERLEAGAGDDDEYTQDGTVDLHGNPVLRSKRGGWKACGFVVGTYVRTYGKSYYRPDYRLRRCSCRQQTLFYFPLIKPAGLGVWGT
jgi:hypothetical protein